MTWLRNGMKIRNKITNKIGILRKVSDNLWEVNFGDGTYSLVYVDQIQNHYEPLIQPDESQSSSWIENRN